MKGKRFRWVERGLGKRVGEVKLARMEKRGKTFRLLRGSVAICDQLLIIFRIAMLVRDDQPDICRKTLEQTQALLDEVRNARLPKLQMAQIWSVEFNTQVRSSLRRLLLEDPWGSRFGAEVRIDHAGPMYKYIVDGTHPDDMPTEQWGPDTFVPQLDGLVPMPVPMQVGDALMMHQHLPHLSPPNTSDHIRWSVDIRFQDSRLSTKSGTVKPGFIARSKERPQDVVTEYEGYMRLREALQEFREAVDRRLTELDSEGPAQQAY